MADRMLCVSPIVKHSDRNLVQGRGEFKVDEENLSLEFAVHSTAPYISEPCAGHVQKRHGLFNNFQGKTDCSLLACKQVLWLVTCGPICCYRQSSLNLWNLEGQLYF